MEVDNRDDTTLPLRQLNEQDEPQSEPYDLNFFYPVHNLESSRLKLTPFIVSPRLAHLSAFTYSYVQPSIHADRYFAEIKSHPESYEYMPMPPFPSVDDFSNWVELRIRRDPSLVLFAMIDKTRLGSPPADESEGSAIAGIIGLLNTVPEHCSTEIGLLFTLPRSQRTHTTTHAVGLLQRWCFDELHMNRVQWRSDPNNVASIRVAERMGFKKEMVRRWDNVLSEGKAGLPVRKNDVQPNKDGLHTTYLSVCRDDWGEHWAERVQDIMDKRR